jgi:hypothetical protein
MSLDQNLFTLIVTPSKENPHVVDLVDPAGRAHYRKQRAADIAMYKAEVYDPMTGALLVVCSALDTSNIANIEQTATAPSASTKIKFLELCNPTKTVELKYTGTLSFKWSFKWEECVSMSI